MTRRFWHVSIATLATAFQLGAQRYTITTVAGSDPVRDGKPASRGLLETPDGVTFDATGRMYIADSGADRIRRVTPDATKQSFGERYQMGEIATVAGVGGAAFSGDGGPATAAHLSSPTQVLVDRGGNLYIAEIGRVRRVDPEGIIRTVAGGGTAPDGEGVPATSVPAQPSGIALDSGGNLYFSEASTGRVRRVSPGGLITTIAGGGNLGFDADGGPATRAQLLRPQALVVDREGNVFVTEALRYAVRKITPEGNIFTVAGTGQRGNSGDGGPAVKAQLTSPVSLAIDSAGRLLILDSPNTIRAVSADGVIEKVFGVDFMPTVFSSIALAPEGNLVMSSGFAIFYLEGPGLGSLLYAGIRGDNGIAACETLLGSPTVVSVDPEGHLYIVDNYVVRAVDHHGLISSFGRYGFDQGTQDRPFMYTTVGMVADSSGTLWMVDSARVLKLDRTSGKLSWIAGTGQAGDTGNDGPAMKAQIESTSILAAGRDGSIYLASQRTNSIRQIGPDGIIRRFAGNGTRGFSGDGGPAAEAQLSTPAGLAIDATGTVYIADSGNRRIRAVSPAGMIITLAGGGTATGDGHALSVDIPAPHSVAVALNGDILFTTYTAVYRLTITGRVERIAGGDLPGFAGDGADALDARLFNPTRLAPDGSGQIYIADWQNHRVRKLIPETGK